MLLQKWFRLRPVGAYAPEGIMRKDTSTAKLTAFEVERNKQISKKRYIVEQYFGLSALHDRAGRARFTSIVKNTCCAPWNAKHIPSGERDV